MERKVLFIPLEEIVGHFEVNDRQDIKIIAPKILSDKLVLEWLHQGKEVKAEVPLKGNFWSKSNKNEANKICESKEFILEIQNEHEGLFAVSFANEKAKQEEHYHSQHSEIYFSNSSMKGYYQDNQDNEKKYFNLEKGGLIVFQQGVIHHMELCGLTLIIEIPSLINDKSVKHGIKK